MTLVDFHFHLEEGPYTWGWLQRTARAMETTGQLSAEAMDRTLTGMEQALQALQSRLGKGAFHRDWIQTFIQQGMDRGISRFGLVDHLYRFTEFRPYYERHMIMEDSELGQLQRRWLDQVTVGSIDAFLEAARSVKQAGYPLSIGVEADYFPGGEEELGELLARYEFDYVIGSVHFIEGWGFDNPQTQHKFTEWDLLALYREGFSYVQQAAKSGLFDIIAHLDNLKVFNHRPDESQLQGLYDEVAAVLKHCDVASEINTGLAYRYPVKEMCPSPSYLAALHRHGVPITLSSDAHYPDDIGTLLVEARELAIQTGYSEIVYFTDRQRRSLSL